MAQRGREVAFENFRVKLFPFATAHTVDEVAERTAGVTGVGVGEALGLAAAVGTEALVGAPTADHAFLHEEDITFAHAANAIAAFESLAGRADNSPFDRYIRGDKDALSKRAEKGMMLFYKGVRKRTACADCHSGIYQTDQSYHAIARPQIGPGRGSNGPRRSGGHEDFGRQQVTGNNYDILKFRTPSLRNVALTAPYGHSGAYNSLRAVVEHHVNPLRSLYEYNDYRQAILPTHPVLDAENYTAMDNPEIVDFIALHNELPPMGYSDTDVDLIMDFLHALTDPGSVDLRSDIDVVNGVPSGLPLDD